MSIDRVLQAGLGIVGFHWNIDNFLLERKTNTEKYFTN